MLRSIASLLAGLHLDDGYKSLSPRNLIDICKMSTVGMSLRDCLNSNYVLRVPQSETNGVDEIIRVVLG